jgi:hypothetical protein
MPTRTRFVSVSHVGAPVWMAISKLNDQGPSTNNQTNLNDQGEMFKTGRRYSSCHSFIRVWYLFVLWCLKFGALC